MQFSTENLTFGNVDEITLSRLGELVLYIATASQTDTNFGKTKLVKLLYMSDFETFRQTGEPITGHRYVKLPNGPFPDDFDQLLDDMEKKGDIFRQHIDRGLSNPQERVIPRRPVNFEMFTSQSIAIVSAVIQEHWNLTGKGMADLTHGIAWKVAEMTHAIPYEASILSDEELTQKDLARIEQLVQEYGENPT